MAKTGKKEVIIELKQNVEEQLAVVKEVSQTLETTYGIESHVLTSGINVLGKLIRDYNYELSSLFTIQ